MYSDRGYIQKHEILTSLAVLKTTKGTKIVINAMTKLVLILTDFFIENRVQNLYFYFITQ